MHRIVRAAALAALVAASGCTVSPAPRQISNNNAPPLAPDRGRVYFYRTNDMMDAADQPKVRLDGVVVGRAVPGGVFYCDLPPGRHVASVRTEVNNTLAFELSPGQKRYIKLDWGFGWVEWRISLKMMPLRTGALQAEGSVPVKAACEG